MDFSRSFINRPISVNSMRKLPKVLRLNLGAGWRPIEGYINQDLVKLKGIDLTFDLNKFPWPLEDNCADEIRMHDVLEHLDDVCAVMKEIHRVLKPGGTANILVPHWNSNGPTFDPTHKHGFGYTTFEYFCKGYRPMFHYYFDFQFQSLKRHIHLPGGLQFWNKILEPLINLVPDVYETTPLKIFPSEGIEVWLTK